MQDSSSPSRSLREHVGLLLRGFCMGAADIVPGVSGGTMAFILGIYEELIDSIHAVGRKTFWSSLVRGKVFAAYRAVNGNFLVAVGAGIALAILTLSHGLEFMLHEYPLVIWSFFFGLVLASAVVVAKRITIWKTSLPIAIIIGALVGYSIVGLVPVQTPDTPWFLVFSGAIAICAMILPGISGSFLLVLLGKYGFVLRAVNKRDVVSIGYVGLGAAVGIVIFSQFLSWLLHRYYDLTIAFLTGLMVGSLRKIWPWKMGELNICPRIDSQELLIGLGCMIAGLIIVIALDKLASKKS